MDLFALLASLAGKEKLIDDVLEAYRYVTGQSDVSPKIGGKFFFGIHPDEGVALMPGHGSSAQLVGFAWLEARDYSVYGGQFYLLEDDVLSKLGKWKASRYLLEEDKSGRIVHLAFDVITEANMGFDAIVILFDNQSTPIIPHSFTCGQGKALIKANGKGAPVGDLYAEWMRAGYIDDNWRVSPVSGLGPEYSDFPHRLALRASCAGLEEDHREAFGVGIYAALGI